MNKAQKIFWAVLGYILAMIIIGFIEIRVVLWMLVIFMGTIVIIAVIFILWLIYSALGDDQYWY